MVGDNNELFLNQIYLDVLNRPIDQPSLDSWLTLLVTGTPRDDIQAELDSMRGGQNIDLELQRLRGELGTGTTQAIEGGEAAPDGAAQPAAAERPQAGDGA